MKVVLFCGGLGMRIRDAEDLPKPMVHIGYRPILWHVMKYYAHFGHKDFLVAAQDRAEVGAKKLELLHSDIHDWRITFADTGNNSNIGMRLKAV